MEKEEILEKLKEVILSWDLPFSEGEIYEDVRLREFLFRMTATGPFRMIRANGKPSVMSLILFGVQR